MIRIEHLTRRFHDLLAVDDVSLTVPDGEVVAFLGPNGAGKTTTIRILTGFLPATSGRAEVAGFDVATDSLAVRRRVGYCPENVPLPLDARVDEYLEYRGRLKGLGRADRARRRDDVLDICGLQPMRRRIVGQLSRGYRQRLGLADALLADPPVLIWDEPTGGLDPGQRQHVLDMVAALKGRKTVLLSSHVLSEMEHVATRVAIINRGRLVAEGTKDELIAAAGRRGEVRIACQDDELALCSWLAGRGLDAEAADGAFIVSLGEEDQGPALLRAAVEAGLPINAFEPLTRSLHQIFLDLTAEPVEPDVAIEEQP